MGTAKAHLGGDETISTLELTIVTGALAFLGLGTAIVLLLRTFFATCVSFAETVDRVDLSWRDYRPIQRLLDPADFAYMRRKHISEDKIKKLRVERRKIYRTCLRSLARDFNSAHRALSSILVHSETDRPELAAELGKQRVTFYRNLMLVEFRLTLYACGFQQMPQIDLVAPLQALQSLLQDLSQLSPAGAAV